MAIAKMPNSCELQDTLGRDWAIQVKPVGADPAEYKFVPGLTSIAVNIETSSVDSTTIDAGGWSSETKTGRSLTVVIDGKIVVRSGFVPDNTQRLIKASGEELGALGSIDLRVWRTDVDEGWEFTANNGYSETAGDANGLRTFNSNLKSSCEPTRIKSVLDEGVTSESVAVDMAEYLAILEPAGTENP